MTQSFDDYRVSQAIPSTTNCPTAARVIAAMQSTTESLIPQFRELFFPSKLPPDIVKTEQVDDGTGGKHCECGETRLLGARYRIESISLRRQQSRQLCNHGPEYVVERT
jgi:hypothetical protein